MKSKLMIALVILALVFGMVLIACDDGDLPEINTSKDGEVILDTNFITYIDKANDGGKELKNGIDDTTESISPYYLADKNGILRYKVNEDGKFVDKDGAPTTDSSSLVPDPNGKPFEDPSQSNPKASSKKMSNWDYLKEMFS